MKNLLRLIKAYTLKNAVEHNGKCQEGSVISSLFHEGLKKEEVSSIIKQVKEIVSEINKLNIEEQKKEFEKLEKNVSHRAERLGLPELPNAEKGVVMRIAPSPSGPLHIGNVLTAGVSFLYVKKYGGIFYVRVEDTNPENIYNKAYDLIKKDSDWLFGKDYRFIVQSDRLSIYYKYAGKLVKLGQAYVCICSQERFKKYSEAKKNCPCRKNTIKQNLSRWEKMLDKKGYKEGEAVLRFKSGMKNKNPAFRDFPLARINLASHPRQNKKYRVWPMMNLAVAADDIELKMTHIIRAKEHRDNAVRQEMIFKALGKKYPWHAYLGRWKFTDLELSKTKTRKAIGAGEFEGWDDPRLATVISLRKRGYKPEAFWKIVERRGLSEVDKVISQKDFFMLLDEFNKQAKNELGS